MIKSVPDCENHRVMRRRSIVAGGIGLAGVRLACDVELEAGSERGRQDKNLYTKMQAMAR
jgi:hypothetical protein